MSDDALISRPHWPVRLGCGFAVLLLLAIMFAAVIPPVMRGRSRLQARMRLEELGAIVQYKNVNHHTPRSSYSQFLHDRLGMEVEPIKSVGTQRPIANPKDQVLLAAFEEVEVVDCRDSDLNEDAFRRLTALRNLKALFVGGRPIAASSFPQIQHLARLEILSIAGEIDKQGWDALATLGELRSLDLRNSRILASPPSYFFSSQCPIQQLSVMGNRAEGEQAIKRLSGMPSVRRLLVWSPRLDDRLRLDDELLKSINAFPSLRELTVVGCEVPGDFSPELLALGNLEKVQLHSCEMARTAFNRCSSWQGKPVVGLSGSSMTIVDDAQEAGPMPQDPPVDAIKNSSPRAAPLGCGVEGLRPDAIRLATAV